jgi:hypothetical protein
LVGAMMKDKNVREMKQRSKVKKKENMPIIWKILVQYNLYHKPCKTVWNAGIP